MPFVKHYLGLYVQFCDISWNYGIYTLVPMFQRDRSPVNEDTIPKIEIPKIEIPKIELPKIEIPKIEIPQTM